MRTGDEQRTAQVAQGGLIPIVVNRADRLGSCTVGLRRRDLDHDRRGRLYAADLDATCPQCGGRLGDQRTGTGASDDGIFCSMACLAVFYEPELRQRAALGPATPSNGGSSGA